METLQARTDSFAKTKRVKNPSKPSSYVTLKWPHPSNFKANADTLAEAGFFYDPSLDDPDNVTCYVCGKELSGWETEDDPFDIHWEKCGKRCCWANVRCGLRGDMDRYGRFTFPDKTRLPTSKVMEKARQETFSVGGGWIHDQIKNHGANSKKMALAGFVCTPQHVGDDLATCMYCHISLSGWDEEDDPMEEHRKRMKPGQICPMFSSSSPDPIPTKPSSRSQSTKPPSKSQSRTGSRSKNTTHQDVLMPTKTYDGDPDAESDSESTATSTRVAAKTPRKGRSTSGSRKPSAKTPARSHTRSTSKSGLRNVMEDDETEAEEAIPSPPPTVKKRTRSRSKSVARNVIEDEEAEHEEAIPAPPPTVKKNARSRSRSVARNVVEEEETAAEETNPAPPQTFKKNAKSKAKSVARSETPDQSEAGDRDEPVPRKTSSRTKAKAKSTPTDDTEDEVPRKPSRSKSKPPPPPAEAVEDTAPRKPSRTKSKIKIFDEEDVVEPGRKSRPVSKAKPAPPREPTRAKATPAATTSLEEESSEFEQPEIIVKPSKKGPSSTKSKPSHKEQVPAIDLFVDDDDDIGGYVPLPSKVASTVELPPLFVPKREKAKTTSVEPETGTTRPVEKEKKKPGRPPKSKARAPSPARVAPAEEEWPIENYHAPLSPASNNAPQPAAREKALTSKAGGKLDEGRTMVVDVLTDDEGEKELEDAKKAKRMNLGVEGKENARVSKQVLPLAEVVVATMKKEKKQEQFSPEMPIDHAPSMSPEAEGEDVQMNDVDAEKSERQDTAPQTPPRATQALPTTVLPPPLNNTTVSTDPESILIPALSKLPFLPLHTLTEAELDMTVEEWIRYQMEVEYDKFKRDGERELLRFKKRAEDVRKIIDGL